MRALRVMTFNLRRDLASDGPHAWAHRRDRVAAAVHEEAPDVLGTQEGLPHQLADLDARLPGFARVGRARDGATDEACALFYRRARFDLVAWGDHWLSDTPGLAGSTTWGNRLPRLVTWAALRDKLDGTITTFANTHFDHESARAREEAARFLARRLPGAVLLGDFNARPGEAPHAVLLAAGWQDAGAGSTEGTYHAFTGMAAGRIDWVLAPPSHQVRAHRVVVRAGSPFVSDHHPVVVEMARSVGT